MICMLVMVQQVLHTHDAGLLAVVATGEMELLIETHPGLLQGVPIALEAIPQFRRPFGGPEERDPLAAQFQQVLRGGDTAGEVVHGVGGFAECLVCYEQL